MFCAVTAITDCGCAPGLSPFTRDGLYVYSYCNIRVSGVSGETFGCRRKTVSLVSSSLVPSFILLWGLIKSAARKWSLRLVYIPSLFSFCFSFLFSSGKNKKEGRLFPETYVVVDDEEKKDFLVCLPSHDSPVISERKRTAYPSSLTACPSESSIECLFTLLSAKLYFGHWFPC